MNGQNPRAGWRRLPLRLMLAILVTLFLVFVSLGMPWDEVGRALLAASPVWLALAVLSNLLIYPPWVLQWKLLASPTIRMPAQRMLGIVTLSSMGTAAMSSLVGTASAVVLLVGRGGMTTMSAASLMVVDQILVGLAKLTVLAIALRLATLPAIAAQGSLVLFALTFGGLAVLFLVAIFRPQLTAGETDTRVRKWLAANLDRLAQSLEVMRRPGLALSCYVLALAKRTTNIGAAYAVAAACGIEPSLTLAVLVVAAVAVTTAVPIVPGSLGVYSATVFMVYDFLGYPAPIALAAGILQHLVELAPAVSAGYLSVIATRLTEHRNET